MARRAAGASSAHVAQVARDALTQGNAVDAVVAGALAAAAESPSVLLGPVQILVGGAGAGLLAIDGRVRQPGMGVPRPRGVLAGMPVPPPARVGVSAFPAALATVLASSGQMSLTRAAGPAIETARGFSPERASVIESVARHGAAALAHDALSVELMSVAGRAAGGALTREDLEEVRPALLSSSEQSLAGGVFLVPWRLASPLDGSVTHVVAAIDARGLAAIACYEAPLEGLGIPALGLVAPLFAAPVMRGEMRVRPGEPCPAPAPMALRSRHGLIELAFGVGQSLGAERSLDAALPDLEEDPMTAAFFASLEGFAVAVVRTGETVVALASA